ncbi:MAG TPA: Gfo/Idh/MocA family oxidoreductase, partial [Mucilaginibacter sp.]
MKIIRWGILGTGSIARKFAADLQYAEDCVLLAVGSRSQAGADAFARQFSVTYAHASYEELV